MYIYIVQTLNHRTSQCTWYHRTLEGSECTSGMAQNRHSVQEHAITGVTSRVWQQHIFERGGGKRVRREKGGKRKWNKQGRVRYGNTYFPFGLYLMSYTFDLKLKWYSTMQCWRLTNIALPSTEKNFVCMNWECKCSTTCSSVEANWFENSISQKTRYYMIMCAII